MIKHFTVTAYLVTKIDGEFKVLLHKHKKIGIWVGMGGHIEANENPLEALIREVKEETNLDFTLVTKDKKLLQTNQVAQLPLPAIFQEEEIPEYKNTPSHKHLDFIYFGLVNNLENIQIQEDYGWFSKKELKSLNLLDDIKRTAKEVLEVFGKSTS